MVTVSSSPITPKISTKGTHILADLYDCNPIYLNDKEKLVDLLHRAADIAHATVLGETSHAFQPHGVTALLLLAESHISIHTWPETGYAAVDVMTCGDTMQPQEAIDLIQRELASSQAEVSQISRGTK